MTDVFEVEQILASRKSKGRTLYKIRWKNFGPEGDTWEPERHLKGCAELLEAFQAKEALGKSAAPSLPKTVSSTRTVTHTKQVIKSSRNSSLGPERDVPSIADNTPSVWEDVLTDRYRGGGDNFLTRSSLRGRFTTDIHSTPKSSAYFLTKRTVDEMIKKRVTTSKKDSSEDEDAPISPFLAAFGIIFVILVLVFIYVTS